jgi:helicase MOV-10
MFVETSLLERLMMSCDVYARKPMLTPYDNRLITKLVRNYRSHPAIMFLPNRLFYDGVLQPHADKLIRESLCQWEHLLQKGFPIVFHGVEGEDMREARSPSFFNPMEVSMVIQYVTWLLDAPNIAPKVKAAHIGIVTPYRKQVMQ